MLLPIMWVSCGAVIVVAAARVNRHPSLLRTARLGMAALYIGAGAAVNAYFLLRGDDYADFARNSYIPYVRDTWTSFVVPNHHLFIATLVAFELAVGVLVLAGRLPSQVAYGAAIAFQIALLAFGWGFYLWSAPMLAALVTLFRAERRHTEDPSRPLPRPRSTRHVHAA